MIGVVGGGRKWREFGVIQSYLTYAAKEIPKFHQMFELVNVPDMIEESSQMQIARECQLVISEKARTQADFLMRFLLT
jgi:hypothetical protein